MLKADPHPGLFPSPAGTGQVDVTAHPAKVEINNLTTLAPLATKDPATVQVLANNQAVPADPHYHNGGHYLSELVLFSGDIPNGYAKADGRLLPSTAICRCTR